MKKAFDQNVSRSKPRLRGLISTLAAPAEKTVPETAQPAAPDFAHAVKAQIERNRAPRPTAAEALDRALAPDASTTA
ncbi:MAG: extensin-like protein, partial [Deltaproteobacteria bacterium]|nr:extensin-like protein [Deltaproteobacteria bacterium]